MRLFLFYLLGMNLLCFSLMGIDKGLAIAHRWRIRERTLLGTAALGGAAGGLVAMYLFRHKTLHLKFSAGLPLLCFGQMLLLLYLLQP